MSDAPELPPAKLRVCILHPHNRADATMFEDGHWESDDAPLQDILNDEHGYNPGTQAMLPYNLVAAHSAAERFNGTLETFVEVEDVPPGCIP